MADSFEQADNRAAAEGRPCPPDEEMVALASGCLPDALAADILEHVSACSPCARRVEQLSSQEDSLARQLRWAAQMQPGPQEPEYLRMERAAKAIPKQAAPPAELGGDTTVSSRISTHDDRSAPAKAPLPETVSLPPALPERIGRYQVQSQLGSGSFGRVYRAHDESLDRPVALKVPRFAGPLRHRHLEEFLDEARAAASLHHPGIVTIYEASSDTTVGCYIAMELVDGQSLKGKIAAGSIPLESAVHYVSQAALAVHYAHKRGLVHRDLKPGNLLVDDDGVKVADFGLALAEEEQRGRAGEYAGTLAYMSPEQLRGETHRLDGRTDVWSLGVILYELMVGRRPFGGNDSDEIRDEILHRAPRPPRQINDKIPAELERICLKCLAKDPEQRYSTAKDVAEELKKYARPSNAQSPHSQWLLLATAAAILVVLSGSALTSVFQRFYLSPAGKAARVDDEAPSPEQQPPYNVDEVAERQVPYRLLANRTPRELFPPDGIAERWLFNEAKEQVWIDTPSTFLVGLGETSRSRFQLNVEISMSALKGYAGLFLGYQPIPGREGWWKCEMVCIRCDDWNQCYLQRDIIEIESLPDNWVGMDRTTPAILPAPSGVSRAMLEVTVSAGRIAEVRWRGEPFPELTKDAVSGLSDCTGGFGVVCTNGSATFHEPRIILSN